MLTVYNVFRRLPGGSGVFLPEVLPRKEDRGAPFQDTVIDTGVGNTTGEKVLDLQGVFGP